MRLLASIPAAAAVLLAFSWPNLHWTNALSAILVAAALALGVSRATASGPTLITAFAGLHFVVYGLINIPEGILFDVIKPQVMPIAAFTALLSSFLTVTVLVAVAGRLNGPESPAGFARPIVTFTALFWRLMAVPAIFILCYFIAGMIIFPFVAQYYAGRAMPGPGAIVAMQVMRSLAILAAAYPVLRIIPRRSDAILVLAVTLPVFGAIVPLLPMNELMPGNVRWVHMAEMTPYYTLFGVILAFWFGAPKPVVLRTA